MIKSLLLAAILALFGVESLSGQTPNGQSEPSARANYPENPLAITDEGDNRSVSPELSAEAKRLYKEAVKYGLAGLFKQAAELFERVVKLKPDYADAYYGLGHAYYDLRQWGKAIESLQRALELNPKDKEAQERLDQALRMMQRDSEDKVIAAKTDSATERHASLNVSSSPATDSAANDLGLTRVYRVGPGDVLDVRLNEGTSPKSTLFTITPSGLLEHPNLTEPMLIAGLTVEEISSRIEEDLKRRELANNPKVSVGVRDYVSHTILVSGLVKEPGTKILRREAIPLYVVVADAQPLPEAASVTLVRNEPHDVYTIELTRPADMNLLVRPGDVITLHANPTQFFYVGGEVKTPGEKTFRRGLTLTQAIIAAGGLTERGREARLARDNGKGFLVVSRYKLKDIDAGKVPDPLIQAGDRITIVD